MPLTEDEVKAMLKAKKEKRREDYDKKLEELKARTLKEQSTVSPLLDESDLKLAASTQANLSQGDILRMYVKNAGSLGLKERRQVFSKVQKERSTHAKEVFLKELSALGRKMHQQKETASDPESRIKNKKDPLKLQLERLTLEDILAPPKQAAQTV